MMLDFEITKETLPVIKTNYAAVEAWLKEEMNEYKGVVVTEEKLSECRDMKNYLAGMRNKIDGYRKEKKKEMSKPIVLFEEQCKDLIRLIEQTEQPIKEGIQVFDDKRREQKKQLAEKIRLELIEEFELSPEYAERLTLEDKYMNLTATENDVRVDLGLKVATIVNERNRDEDNIEIIARTVANENVTLKTPIGTATYETMYRHKIPMPEIMDNISQAAREQREAENAPVANDEPKVENIPEPIAEKHHEEEPTPTGPDFFVDLVVVGPRQLIEAAILDMKSKGLRVNEGKMNVLL
jgi:hypothetical protein